MTWGPCKQIWVKTSFWKGTDEAQASPWDLEQHGGVGRLQLCGLTGSHAKPRRDRHVFRSHKKLRYLQKAQSHPTCSGKCSRPEHLGHWVSTGQDVPTWEPGTWAGKSWSMAQTPSWSSVLWNNKKCIRRVAHGSWVPGSSDCPVSPVQMLFRSQFLLQVQGEFSSRPFPQLVDN